MKINITASKSKAILNDTHFRYQRDALQVETKAKSTITNMKQVSKQIDMDPQVVTKYFNQRLSVPCKYDEKSGSATIGKKLNQSEAETILNSFITKYVLCEGCGLPELNLSQSRSAGTLKMECRACPHTARVKGDDKFTAFLIKNLPPPIKKKKVNEDNWQDEFVFNSSQTMNNWYSSTS
jgi:translation initiation factor 5